MNKESLLIRMLGPIHEVELNDISPLMALVGESGGGKSSAYAFSEIYCQVAEPEPLNCALCKNRGFEAYITHNVVLE